MAESLSEKVLGTLSSIIADQMGLHYPKDRWRDLERALIKAARDLESPTAESYAEGLTTGRLNEDNVDALAKHLTVGETHFFRHEKVFQIMEDHIIPDIAAERRFSSRRLRIWSAGCATGEEPYSIAMVVRKTLPDLASWNVTILGTDINKDFLAKARKGVYGQWSFRTVPPGVREAFFNENGEGTEVAPDIRSMVKFAYLNLATEGRVGQRQDTHSMDMIFCRNVLMYFTPEKQKEVIEGFFHSLVDGGWLVVSPAEASVVLHPQFVTVNYPGVVMYRKDLSHKGRGAGFQFVFPPRDTADRSEPAPLPEFPLSTPVFFRPETNPFLAPFLAEKAPESPDPRGAMWPVPDAPFPDSAQQDLGSLDADGDIVAEARLGAEAELSPYLDAEALYEQGRYSEAAQRLLSLIAGPNDGDAASGAAMALLARSYANQGKLDLALDWVEKSIARDKLNADYHYLHGTILQEQGLVDDAVRSLTRAVFPEPNLVVAHFALGNIARRRGSRKDADRHYRVALKILGDYDDEAPVPAAEGITAGRLVEMILAMGPKETQYDRTH